MNMDPDDLLRKPIRTIQEWAYYAAEEAAYTEWRQLEAEWRASRSSRQVH